MEIGRLGLKGQLGLDESVSKLLQINITNNSQTLAPIISIPPRKGPLTTLNFVSIQFPRNLDERHKIL